MERFGKKTRIVLSLRVCYNNHKNPNIRRISHEAQLLRRDQCVTGSCHCLEVGGKRILVDCGLQQGRDEVSNAEFPFAAGSVDYVLVTHAHIDHSGRIPMLIKQGFQGRILTTRLTADLLDIMLLDSAHIQEQDAEWKNRKAERSGAPRVEPLYTIEVLPGSGSL